MRTLGTLALSGACILLGISSMAAAGVIRDDRNDNLYTGLAQQPQYAAVGMLSGNSYQGAYRGSGTLISPSWVLTAAHCVDIATSLTFTINGQNYQASRWVAYPQWNGDLLAGNDIGLIQLKTPVTGVTPATRYTGKAEVGNVGTFVGYGLTGTGLTGSVLPSGTKRAGDNALDTTFGPGGRILMVDFDDPNNASASTLGSSTPLNLEYLIAPGDSGGGLFMTVGTQTTLIGVNSFGMTYNPPVRDIYGELSGDTRVSPFNGWINSVIGSRSNKPSRMAAHRSSPLRLGIAGANELKRKLKLDPKVKLVGSGLEDTMPELSAAVQVPEPATTALLALGAALMLRRRRRC